MTYYFFNLQVSGACSLLYTAARITELISVCFLCCPFSGVLKYQTNIEAHPPGCLRANQSGAEQRGEELEQAEDEERRCREEAHFQPHYPQVCACVLRDLLTLPFKGVLLRVHGGCLEVCVIRGVASSGRGRRPQATSRPGFVCVSSCTCDYVFAHGC